MKAKASLSKMQIEHYQAYGENHREGGWGRGLGFPDSSPMVLVLLTDCWKLALPLLETWYVPFPASWSFLSWVNLSSASLL